MGKGGMPEKVLQRCVCMVTDCILTFLNAILDSESDFCLRFEGHLRKICCWLSQQDLLGCCKKFMKICAIDAK